MFRTWRADLNAVLERDPAWRSRLEAWLCYPGLHALALHRVAHTLHGWGLRLPARLLSEYTRWLTGIEIHPGARIGSGVFIDHGTGVVIGETAEVGDNVTMYQGVTLGGTGKERGKRHPTLGRDVMVSAGAKILGDITIGDRCKIGAGAVVIHSVPADCTVVGVPGRIVRHRGLRVTGAGADLEHADLPDPVEEQLRAFSARCAALEQQIAELRAQLGEQRERCAR